MQGNHQWYDVATFERQHPELADQILAAVADRGPVPLGQLAHLGEAIKRTKPAPGNMWNWTPAKRAVEWLFWTGQVSAVRNPATFERSYVLPHHVVPRAVIERPTPLAADAQKALLLLAARSHGVATAASLADYHRLNLPVARGLVAELAADGALREVAVEGLEATGVPAPRRRAARGGCGRRPSCRRSTPSCGTALAPRRCSASGTASRSTSPPPSGCTATTCSRSCTAASWRRGWTSRGTARQAP